MVGQRQVIGGVNMPVVAAVDPGARAPGIALVHREDPIFVAQHRHRVHPYRRCGRVRRAVPPERKLRAQPPRRKDHQRKTAAVHLVIDLAVGNFERRHASLLASTLTQVIEPRGYPTQHSHHETAVVLWPSSNESSSPPPRWRCRKPGRSLNRAKSIAWGWSVSARPTPGF